MALSAHDLCSLVQSFLADIDELVGISDNSTVTFIQQLTKLQRQFQQIIEAFEATHIDPQVEQRLRPFLTEGHRRLRLAGVEAMRLRAAKQPAAIEKQRSHIQAHLDQLQKFVRVIADEVCPDS